MDGAWNSTRGSGASRCQFVIFIHRCIKRTGSPIQSGFRPGKLYPIRHVASFGWKEDRQARCRLCCARLNVLVLPRQVLDACADTVLPARGSAISHRVSILANSISPWSGLNESITAQRSISSLPRAHSDVSGTARGCIILKKVTDTLCGAQISRWTYDSIETH